MLKQKLFCDGWEFSKNPIGTEYSENLKWIHVDIPHDWLIGQTKNLYETSTGWYRKVFSYEKKEHIRAALRFDGVYMDSKVYVNGTLVGEWKYGYSTFEFDITELLNSGENLVTVQVNYRSPNSRWYSGAGIYRKVLFREYNECHIVSDGIYICSDIDGSVTISAEAECPESVPVSELSVRRTIMDGENIIAERTSPCAAYDRSCMPETVLRGGCKYSVNTDTFKIDRPILWSIEEPYLYTCVCELIRGEEVIDREEVRFGIKKAEFMPDKGFFLNGKHVKLHGCCEHHDLGALGAAVNRRAIERKLEKLRSIGINAIRTSHNMPAAELMELADEMGILVLSEGFDMWEKHKTEYDYAGYFPEWIKKDVASWVRRDRNHASLIGWSIGNEIYDAHESERGQEVTSLLVGLVRRHDPCGNGHVTMGSNYMQWENAQKCTDIMKLAGYNYAERLYEEHHKAHPDWTIYGSETASTIQSRGIYHFPLSQTVLADDDEQCSALGNCATGWGAQNTEACIIPDRDAEYCAGQFIWTGFDYIGEPTPYSTKNSYFGQFDTAGFPKDSAYIYRAEWTDCKESPFVHIFPYWDFIEDQDIDVRVTSNAPEVELFFNGEKIAGKKIDHLHGKELTLDAIVKYKKGELLAVAYDENGNEIARDIQRSFGNTASLCLEPDKTTLSADGTDLIFLEISAQDKDGIFVANANDRVNVEVSGAGRLIGLDNGDSTDYEEYKGTSRRLFSGKLLAIIAAKTEAGEINVKVTSPALPESILKLTAVPAEVPEGISAYEENSHSAADCPDEANDIPVRKIEFISDSRVFTPERKEITFSTKIYPENSSYKNDIEYRVTTVLGITSNLAEIVSSDENSVTVKCKGDGEFYLRALCKNGTDKYHILTPLLLKGEGLGAASFDPYGFVIGGLFTVQSGNAGNGIERGAAFSWGNSWFGFENVDFGNIGSDTVTVPIYANCTTPVKIRFYDGIPTDGGELIGEFTYHEPPEWLTYKPNTFKLNKVLKGVHTFVMESGDGFHVKGFSFEKPIKEISEINAIDCDRIYGDKFTVGNEAVTGIGNNVVLEFGEFDFTEHRPSKIIITGRSQLDVNSIHVTFKGDTETRILAEFTKSENYAPQEFPVDGISGKCNVSFTFLPGSDFDFSSFRFE